MAYSVVIVDDEKMVIDSLALGFPWKETQFQIIAAFQNSKTALEQIKILRPDVVFSDIKMPGITGLEMMEQLKEEYPGIKFVFISGHEDFSFAHKALNLGAVGYCLKPLEDEEIMEVLGNIQSQLEERQTKLEALFFGMLQKSSAEQEEIFCRDFSALFCGIDKISIAASIDDVEEELVGFVHYVKLRYEKDTYFYFIFENKFLEAPGFHQRIRRSIQNGKIRNFVYTVMQEEELMREKLDLLLNQLYTFFTGRVSLEEDCLLQEKTNNDVSAFFRKLEEEYCRNDYMGMLNTLTDYKVNYPREERNISDAIRIYNLVMAAIYKRGQNYYEEIIVRPYELTESFKDVEEMLGYLGDTMGNQGASLGERDMELIKNNTFKEIIQYVNTHFAGRISFQNICKEYSMNPSYLSQIFQRELGTTFTSYLTGLRMNYAKELLTNTNLTIAEISDKVGYDQYFYFSKIFKKNLGISPTAYRSENQKKEKFIPFH